VKYGIEKKRNNESDKLVTSKVACERMRKAELEMEV
jgi:hypothetical protein